MSHSSLQSQHIPLPGLPSAPIVPAAASLPGDLSHEEASRNEPVKFLLVDDLEANLVSMEALLRRDDLVILKATSGDEALELLLKHDVALALVDVRMPGLDGFELAELMRGSERARRVPIIFVTAGSEDAQRRFRGYEAGAVDFIRKPIEPEVLRMKTDVFFELFRQRQQLAAQRDELRLQAEALREADRRKDEFLATLAHELRNPLAPVKHGLELLRRNPKHERSSEIREMMDRQLGHLVRLTDDLLDVSRVSHGKIELRKEIVDVRRVILDAVEATRPLFEAAGHLLNIELPEDPLWIDADPTRMSQVVANLLNNAAKYTPAGGKVRFRTALHGTQVLLEVSDNGIGFPVEMGSGIFQLFTQLGHHLDRAQGGLGIGLALVKELVAMQGGAVEGTSPGEGKGSVFTVRMPLAQPPAVEVPRDDSQQQKLDRGLRILVVDDNADVGFAVGLLLEELGHEFELAEDGPTALDLAGSYEPEVVLLDIGLPGMDGYQVCKAFRAEEKFRNVLIIAQTGWGQDRDKDLAREAGFDHHLTKPLSADDLQELLKRFLAEKR